MRSICTTSEVEVQVPLPWGLVTASTYENGFFGNILCLKARGANELELVRALTRVANDILDTIEGRP